jgi:hypothetical protein
VVVVCSLEREGGGLLLREQRRVVFRDLRTTRTTTTTTAKHDERTKGVPPGRQKRAKEEARASAFVAVRLRMRFVEKAS